MLCKGQKCQSSPRMRGARHIAPIVGTSPGIIPADAGSTLLQHLLAACLKDHPRGCGEHSKRLLSLMTPAGSSPRMRGARIERIIVQWRDGIIPADAGSTTLKDIRKILGKDHPRGCGEHSDQSPADGSVRGSSPRMRGARLPLVFSALTDGIIPADAGSTSATTVSTCSARDHPRGCGEHSGLSG